MRTTRTHLHADQRREQLLDLGVDQLSVRRMEAPLDQLVGSLAAYVDFVAANPESHVSSVRAAAAGDEDFHRI